MINCAICNGKEVSELLNINEPDRFELSIGVEKQGYSRKWVECLNCGLAINILPAESEGRLSTLRAAYYEVDFLGSDINQKYQRVMSMPESESDNAGRVNRVVNFAKRWFGASQGMRVMDIGAGTGVFLSRLVDQTAGALKCIGVEPDPRAAEHLRSLGKFDVIEAMFLGQAELKNFNLVTLNKVLEHIEHPLKFLQQVVISLQAENGLLYIEVPDKITTQLRDPNDNILGALHCNLYDPLSLTHIINRAGLEVIRIDRLVEPSGKLTVYAFAAPAISILKKGLPHE
jgi:hypothetical protein